MGSIDARHGPRGLGYRYRWIDADGVRRTGTAPTKALALRALQSKEVEAAELRAGLRARPKVAHTFADLARYWIEHRAAEKRSGRDDRGVIARYFLPTFGPIDLRGIGREQLDAFRVRLEAIRFTRKDRTGFRDDPAGKPLSPRTVHKILTMLGSMLRYAEELGWIDAAPRPRKPSIVSNESRRAWLRTQEAIDRFLRAAAAFDADDEAARARGGRIKGERIERTHAPGVLPLYATAVYTGMRLGELAALRWDAVDMTAGRIRVCRSHGAETTKGGYARTVPIVDALAPILRAWRIRSPGPHVFPNVCGHRRGEHDRVWRETLRRVLEGAEIPREDLDGRALTFHSLRHTWASHLVMRGVDLFTLQKMGGWKSHDMVQVYAHLTPEAFDGVRGLMPAPDLAPRAGTVRRMLFAPRPAAPTPNDSGLRDAGVAPAPRAARVSA